MSVLDFRSDTITRPTPAMAEAIARAAADASALDDDVLGRDPTVRALEERCAALFQMQAALFVPSGTMGNLLAVRSQTEPGDELFCHPEAHVYYYEGGGYAAAAGCSVRFVGGRAKEDRGRFTPEQIRGAIRYLDDDHFPRPRLLCLENTHNRAGGTVWPLDDFERACDAGHEIGLRVHLDGARIWNAAVAAEVPASDYTCHVDTVSACFSKGLGCPVGSILAGDAETIRRAKRFRKVFGGAMRQSGVLAAAAMHALDHHVDRLADDHANARRLAEGLNEIEGLHVDEGATQTNLVYCTIDRPLGSEAEFVEKLRGVGVECLDEGPQSVRFVTHLHLSADDIDEALARIGGVLA